MKKEIADLWVADLRTNPPQHRGELKNLDGPGHCCLGRLCVVLGMEQEAVTRYSKEEIDNIGLGSEIGPRCTLSKVVINAAGMRCENVVGYLSSLSTVDDDPEGVSLANMNDAGSSFAEIADIIEKHWEEL